MTTHATRALSPFFCVAALAGLFLSISSTPLRFIWLHLTLVRMLSGYSEGAFISSQTGLSFFYSWSSPCLVFLLLPLLILAGMKALSSDRSWADMTVRLMDRRRCAGDYKIVVKRILLAHSVAFDIGQSVGRHGKIIEVITY